MSGPIKKQVEDQIANSDSNLDDEKQAAEKQGQQLETTMTGLFKEALSEKAAKVWPRDWIAILKEEVKLPPSLHGEWQQHADISKNPKFAYYALLDAKLGGAMVWRFTSRPTKEPMFFHDFTKNRTELLKQLVMTLGRHTAKNVKNDPNICLQSFSRNLGSFIATAASRGGDPEVKNIINTAKYLVGISIDGVLANHGISAHPSFAKKICVIETEYVLVPTPGSGQFSVAQLATVVYKNPFVGEYPTPAIGLKPAPTDQDELDQAVDMSDEVKATIDACITAAMAVNESLRVGTKLTMHTDPADKGTSTFKNLATLAGNYGGELKQQLKPPARQGQN